MDIFETMETCRAMRRLKPDPVSQEILEKLVWSATRAPNAGNAQLWDFVIVTEEKGRQFLGDLLRTKLGTGLSKPKDTKTPGARQATAFWQLVTAFEQIPAIIFPCIRNGYPPTDPNPLFMSSSIYPATQNLLLAARALGLGTVMTTFHIIDQQAIKEYFGIPSEVFIGATIPIGYPEDSFGPVKRKPTDEVIHWEHWGTNEVI